MIVIATSLLLAGAYLTHLLSAHAPARVAEHRQPRLRNSRATWARGGEGVERGELRGVVVDRRGTSLVSAVVTIVSDDQPVKEIGQRVLATLQTDTGGGFALTGVPLGAYTITASAAGFLPTSRAAIVREGPPSITSITLERGGVRVSGVVSDTGAGPIGDVQVLRVPRGFRGDERGFASTLTDSNGHYQLFLPIGDHSLIFQHDGYAERILDVRADRDQVLDVRLDPGVRLAGRVVMAAGQSPVAGAVVTVRRVRDSEDFAWATTDSNGQFAIGGLGPATVEVVARRDDLAGGLEEPLRLPTVGEKWVEVAIGGAATVKGRVIHPSGAPVPHARLELGRAAVDTWRGDPAGSADADGRFVIRGVLPQHNSVIAHGPGLSFGRRPIVVGTDDLLEGVQIVVPEVRQLTVNVVSDNQPVAHARVRGLFPGGPSLEAQTDAAGKAVLSGMPVGEDTVSASDGQAEVSGRTQVTESGPNVLGLSIARPHTVTIEGTVHWQDGRPAGEVPVYVFCNGPYWDRTSTDNTGQFRFSGCQPGDFAISAFRHEISLSAWRNTYLTGSQNPLTDDEQVRSVQLQIQGGRKIITGKVVGPDAQPIADAQVAAEGFLEQQSALTDAAGNFTLNDLTREEHTLTIEAAGYPPATAATDSGPRTEVTIRLERGGTLRGRVATADGKPLPFVRVMARTARGGRECYSSRSGRFFLDGLSAGDYDVYVRAFAPFFDVKVASTRLGAGETRDLALVVPAARETN